MFRIAICAAIAALAAAMTGCVAGGGHCGACDGGYGPRVPQGPLAAAHNWRKNLICGNGCGEIYYGDYINNPPDCCDPCDNEVQCTPPIRVRPGLFVFNAFTQLYGKRVPNAGACCDTGCDACGEYDLIEPGCSSCGGGTVAFAGGSGCSSCQSGGSSYIASEVRPRAPLTRSAPTPSPTGSRTNSRTIRR